MKKLNSIVRVLLLTLVPFTASAQSYPRGDVDQDGMVSIADVTTLIDNLLNDIAHGDVDRDGVIGIADVTTLIDYLLKGSWPDEPVTPPDNHEWVDLGLPSGTQWATMNVGASCPEDYGDYFAWGETEPKEFYTWDTYKWYKKGYYDANNVLHQSGVTKYCNNIYDGFDGFIDGKTELEPEDDAATANWGTVARMPSHEQIEELLGYCSHRWTQRNGVRGELFTGPNGNTMFLPAAGHREWSLEYAESSGSYWSRMLDPAGASNSFLSFAPNRASLLYRSNYRIYGLPVRAVRVQ